jgi:hypothetical protein
MAIILPTISPDYLSYRIPDNNINPTISSKDYFYTPTNKDFIFKASNGTVTYVNIDFWAFDNSFFNNKIFTTLK